MAAPMKRRYYLVFSVAAALGILIVAFCFTVSLKRQPINRPSEV